MPPPHLTTLCLVTTTEHEPAFRVNLDRFLTAAPEQTVEFRLGFHQAASSLHYVLGLLNPDDASLEHTRLPQGVERFRPAAPVGRSFCCWSLPAQLPTSIVLRWLWSDLPLTTDYVVWVEDPAHLDDAGWQAMSSALRQGGDVFGPLVWRDFLPGEVEWLLTQPWYRGVPFLHRDHRPGVEALEGGWLAFRVASLRQAGFFDSGLLSDGRRQAERVFVWLAEMARQLGWRHTPPQPSTSMLAQPVASPVV